jgi:hypothetical protein
MDINTQIKTPKFNWDKILIRAALFMLAFTGIALVSRWRTFMVMAEIVDIVIILGLLCLAAYALVAKSDNSK